MHLHTALKRSGFVDFEDWSFILCIVGNYTEDFQKTARHTIQLVNDRIVTGVTLAQCAKNCVDMEAGSCASFSYCDLKSICRLSTASLKNVGQVSATPSATCDMYTSK